MSGIYIHIPFCRKNCSYCDFYFSLNKKHEPDFFNALRTELALRKNELQNELIETIYLGGGTPSYASLEQLERVFYWIYTSLPVAPHAEITLEANPEDLNPAVLEKWKSLGINRLSIGVQSFEDKYLQLLNRSHTSKKVFEGLSYARRAGFENISIDLIYGIPGMDLTEWEKQIDYFLDLSIPHLSGYALTVEKGTLLHHQVKKGIIRMPEDEIFEEMFFLLIDKLEKAGYSHYEISNWAKPGMESKHNRSYWLGKKYAGFGPSAHSYDGLTIRKWNKPNLHQYIKNITEGNPWYETEKLSEKDRFNELIMTRLRTDVGVDNKHIKLKFPAYYDFFKQTATKLLHENKLIYENDFWRIPRHAKFITDGIIEEFFVV